MDFNIHFSLNINYQKYQKKMLRNPYKQRFTLQPHQKNLFELSPEVKVDAQPKKGGFL